jgi:5-formyltetrahydrofolate cyclo-ligase
MGRSPHARATGGVVASTGRYTRLTGTEPAERRAGVAETSDTKRDLRARVRAERAAVPADSAREAAETVSRRALALPEVAAARAVLAYAALPEELDPAPLVGALRALGARIALPRVCGPGTLALHWVGDAEPLEPGHAGILEPAASCDWAAPLDFDLVLVPGVAFDSSCARLGFGGGFYDALLPSLPPDVATVGLAYDEQIVEQVPSEAHDERVSVVVTPSGVHRRA